MTAAALIVRALALATLLHPFSASAARPGHCHGHCCTPLPRSVRKGADYVLPLTPALPSVTHVEGTGLRIVLQPTQRLAADERALGVLRRAAARWEALVTTDVTIVVATDYGPDFFGEIAFPPGVLAFTDPAFADAVPLATARQALLTAGAPSRQTTWLSIPEEALPTESGQPRRFVRPVRANAQAIGLVPSREVAFAAHLAINSNNDWDFDQSDGIGRDLLDLDALAVHELGHVLGFVSSVSATSSETFTPLDLYRTRPGAIALPEDFAWALRVLSPGPPGTTHVFSGGPAEVPLSTGYAADGGDGYDGSHWVDEELEPFRVFGIMKPRFFASERSELADNDLQALEAIGWRVRLPVAWADLELPESVDLGSVPGNWETTLKLPLRNLGGAPGRVSVEVVSYDNLTDAGLPKAELTLSPVAAELEPGEARSLGLRLRARGALGRQRAVVRLHTSDQRQLLHDFEIRFAVTGRADLTGWALY